MNLKNLQTGATLDIGDSIVWRAALAMAEATGVWKPAGTRPVSWWNACQPPHRPWAGQYFGRDEQRITAADAHNLAAGLEAGLARWPRTLVAAKAMGPYSGSAMIHPGGGFSEQAINFPWAVLYDHGARKQVEALVPFLRAVALPDGELEIGPPLIRNVPLPWSPNSIDDPARDEITKTNAKPEPQAAPWLEPGMIP